MLQEKLEFVTDGVDNNGDGILRVDHLTHAGNGDNLWQWSLVPDIQDTIEQQIVPVEIIGTRVFSRKEPSFVLNNRPEIQNLFIVFKYTGVRICG